MGTIGFGGLCQIHGPYARTPMGNWFTVAVSGELGSWVHREWNRIKICFAFFFYFTNRTVSFFFFFCHATQFSGSQFPSKELNPGHGSGHVQEVITKTIPKKKKCKKAPWLSKEALQTAEKRREAKGKGEKERQTHLNAEFQRIARRDKKAFLSEQHKEMEENNRMGKTRDPFKKIGDTKGTLHAKMGSIKDKTSKDLTEAEGIKKRSQKHTTVQKKLLMT